MDDAPPYLRIAAEIRRRIAEGELAPGDRVPSTRRIALEWNVALATAAKALAHLSRQGLVTARPRAGTVVAAPPGPAGPPPARPPGSRAEQELGRERIVRAAVEIADAEGLAALSMRAVAARLGVAVMTPYRHVAGKDDLVLLMADAVYGEERLPAEPPEGWRARLELGARVMWRIHRRHPWLAQIGSLTRPLMVPNLVAHSEWLAAALAGHGLEPAAVLDVSVLLYSHIQGIAVNLEREAQARAATGLSDEQWMDRRLPALRALAAPERHPAFSGLLTALGTGYDPDLDALFEFGLGLLLDGLAARLGERA